MLLPLHLLLELTSFQVFDTVLALKVLDPLKTVAHAANAVPCRLLIVVVFKSRRGGMLLLLLLLHNGLKWQRSLDC